MNFLAYLKIALSNLNRNKFRSFLTLLGIILGIASVTSIYTIGVGLNNMIAKQFTAMGTNSIILLPFKLEFGKSSGRSRGLTEITMKDIKSLQREFPEISTIVPKLYSRDKKASYKNKFSATSLAGTTPDFFSIDNKELDEGNYFGMLDVKKNAKVCVLGKDVANDLFSGQSANGKKIRVGNEVFEVIGVLKKYPKGRIYFGQLDKEIIIPYTTLDMIFSKKSSPIVSDARIVIYNNSDVDEAQNKIKMFLRQRKKVPETEEEAFTVTTAKQFAETMEKLISEFISFLSVITFISLAIGGIGIMNIMLVSVTERTKEIGIRMAVGAKQRDIILQFLTEAVILSVLGGVAGILLSLPASLAISKTMSWPTKVSWWVVTLAFIYSTGIGVLFGYYPAKNASDLDPIEALRYE